MLIICDRSIISTHNRVIVTNDLLITAGRNGVSRAMNTRIVASDMSNATIFAFCFISNRIIITDNLCIAQKDFVIAGRQCNSSQTSVPFTEIKPSTSEDGHQVAYLAEGAEYDDEQARLAAIQRLLVIAGYDAAPIDGVDGPKTQNALAAFLKARGLAANAAEAPGFFDAMIAAVESPSATGLTWCNDTPYRVMASIATDDGKAITSRGWYRIEPGKCLHPDVSGQPRRLFSFAEAVDPTGRTIKINSRPLNWGGSTMLCTREAQFEFSEQGDCGARGLNANGYDRIDMTAGTGKTIRFGMP